jgi:hypothetical protein
LARTFVWLDVCAVNQHSTAADDFNTYLPAAIGSTRQTLLCLDAEGLVFTRIWCLYEVWVTVDSFGADKLRVLLSGVDSEAAKHIYYYLDVSKAQASKPEDEKRILDGIKHRPGVAAMNQQIKDAIIQSAETTAAQFAAQLQGDKSEDAAQSLLDAVSLLDVAGQYDRAEPLARSLLALSEAQLNGQPANTTIALYSSWLAVRSLRSCNIPPYGVTFCLVYLLLVCILALATQPCVARR